MIFQRTIRRLKQSIKLYFGFSSKEINGIFILFLIIVIAIITPTIVQKNLYNSSSIDQDSAILKSWLDSIEIEQTQSIYSITKEQNERIQPFDPNTATLLELTNAGIPNKIATRLIKYRTKGGKFKNSQDITKIFGFNDKLYNEIKSYIVIKSDVVKSSTNQLEIDSTSKAKKPKILKLTQILDLNEIDTSQLQTLKGIGKILSIRIIKYRQALGGFISINQLKEVYGLSPEVIKDIESKVSISNNYQPNKINLNKTDYLQLKNHPYIKGKLASVILNYKNFHGEYRNLNELKNIKIISEEDYLRMLPYLSL